MARVKAFSVEGVRMWFWSHDHRPPHLHASSEDGAWEVSVWILRSGEEIVSPTRPPTGRMRRAHRRAIIEGVERHREELLEEWEGIHGDREP